MTLSPHDTADEVIEAFALEPQQDLDTLLRYLDAYPDHAAALVDFALELEIVAADLSLAATAANEKRASEALARLQAFDEQASATADKVDLFAGVDLMALETATGIARVILMSLRNREVETDSIDLPVLTKLARYFRTGIESLRSTLERPSALPVSLAFKSTGKPTAGSRRPLAYFMENSGLTEEQKRRTLEPVVDGD